MSLVDLTEDKLKQIEQQLQTAYDSIFHHDDKKYKPKNKTIMGTIENNFPLIVATAVGTLILMKVADKYEIPKRTIFDNF